MKRAICLLLLAACAKKEAAAAPAALKGGARKLQYPVETATTVKTNTQYNVQAGGSLEAFQQVQITSRVAGAVDKVLFAEGQVVQAGDVLVTIEGERFELALEQAQTSLAKAQANEKSAEDQLARRTGTDTPNLIAGEDVEIKQTAVDTAKADVDAAREAVKMANLNLRDSSVRAPIAGVVQTRTVQVGQYLQTGAVLATILQRDPMLLRFQVSEQDAPRLKPGMQAQLTMRESSRQYTAKITLVSGTADPLTRLVPVTGEIDDTEHQYWLRPGAYCEVSVPVGDARPGIVVPSMAVEPTEKGNVVYVVDDKNIAHEVQVQLGMHTTDGYVEITRGLDENQQLVIRGLEPLSDGAAVKIAAQGSLDPNAPDAGVPPAPPPTQAGATGSSGGKRKKATP
jgi:RND family efflux transporter MFP subunit